MISLPFRRSRRNSSIDALYGMIVAQARAQSFFLDYGAPDTVSGRLDMIVLHLVLVLRRLTALGAGSSIGQPLLERFLRDMDHNLREMGIGDLAVPKHMQRVAEAYYGRAKAYDAALGETAAGNLEFAVARNVFGTPDPPLGARRLAAYMRETVQHLERQGLEALSGGTIEFPSPETIADEQPRAGR